MISISQEDFDQLHDKLRGLREHLQTDPNVALTRIDALREEAQEILTRSKDTNFEPAINSVCGLLDSLRRGISTQVFIREAYSDTARIAA